MAIKTLMLRKKIEAKKESLKSLREKDVNFEKREKELEKSVEEAETDEEREAVGEEVDKFTEEKDEQEKNKADLEAEIAELEKELKELEEKEPSEPNTKSERSKTKREMGMKNIEIRSLPKNIRAFDALPIEERNAIVETDSVQSFLTEFRSAAKTTRAISGGELNLPVELLEIVYENKFRYSKLTNRVRVREVTGQARQTIAGTVPEAVWTEMCGAINELTFVFNQITIDGYKVAGYIPVCNSLLEDLDDINLAGTIVEMLAEALGLAEDKAILYGKGSAYKMPLGIVTRLAQQEKPTDYPANAPEWVDLHTTNVLEISADKTGAEFWAALTIAVGNTYTEYSRGNQFWAMSSKTLALLKSKAITFTASGDVVANIYDTMPIINEAIEVLEFIPYGDIIGGYGDLYLWATRAGMQIEESREVQFIQDNTVFRGKERADGTPIIPQSFVAININGNDVTTSMPFAADNANDSLLESLTVGTETLSPTFDPAKFTYTITASGTSGEVEVTPAKAGAQVAISYNGKNVRNGGTITFEKGMSTLTVSVNKGNSTNVYAVNITKAGG